jgi:hypothetical protein
MKTVDVPFTFDADRAHKTITKTGELKEKMAEFLKKAEPEKVKSLKVGAAYDMKTFAKLAKEKDAPEIAEKVEKLVGKSGYAVALVRKKRQRGAVYAGPI